MPRPLLADRFVLCPSRAPIETGDKVRLEVPLDGFALEVWVERTAGASTDEAQVFILKFGGAGGRAERSTLHPADVFGEIACEVWSVNPPGYGGSGGRASLTSLSITAVTVFERLAEVAGDRPILITGNSLGAATALSLAAARPVAGLLLRNPPPLKQLIVGRHGWWNLWVGAMAVARSVPAELDSIANAARCKAPAVIVSGSRDEIVPPAYQQRVLEAYAGPKRIVKIPDGRHISPIPDEQAAEYVGHLHWLLEQAGVRLRRTAE